MSKYGINLNQILEMIERLENQITKGKTKFMTSIDDYDMAVLRLQVIGECIKKLPTKIKIKYSNVNWKILVRFRDIVSHDYIAVNKRIFSKILKNEIPPLKKAVKQIKKELK